MILVENKRHRRATLAALRAAGVALLFPVVVTVLAAFPSGVSRTSVALAYVLAVVASAALGGLWAGLGASVLSFLALNFFFTEPLRTFTVDKHPDLVALVVYLLVSALVATLLSRALSQRARAERREQEARLLEESATRLLSGDEMERVLEGFARAVVGLFALVRCEIETEMTPTIAVNGSRPNGVARKIDVIPMLAKDEEVGSIKIARAVGQPLMNDEERDVIRTLASQMALAMTGMRFASEARDARMKAEASSLRAALFSSVSHDLRTPLASITASVTSLLDAGVQFTAEDKRELLETIRQEAERLNRLVGNLLELSRMRAGALVSKKAPVAIDEVIDAVLARSQQLLNGHHVRLLIRDNLPEVPIDVVQVDQLLTNLLENAAKFSPPGTEIRISASRWHDVMQVRVADQGSGIPSSERERVFEPFVRGESDAGAGTGLGLSIARAIVTAHGGKIRLEDAPGGGTAAVFEIPLH